MEFSRPHFNIVSRKSLDIQPCFIIRWKTLSNWKFVNLKHHLATTEQRLTTFSNRVLRRCDCLGHEIIVHKGHQAFSGLTRKPNPFVTNCLPDTSRSCFVSLFFFPYCVSYLGNCTRKYFMYCFIFYIFVLHLILFNLIMAYRSAETPLFFKMYGIFKIY